MRQAAILDGGLDGHAQSDHHAHHASDQPAARSDAELLARARRGDQIAWDTIVDRYGGLVWAITRAHGLSPDDAADVSQVTWLLLVQHLASMQEPERLGVWLLRIASREASRMRRLRGYEVPEHQQPRDPCRPSSKVL